MMDYEEFKKYIKGEMSRIYGDTAFVGIKRFVKNNGEVLDGLTVFKEGEHISPTIYLEGCYEKYRNGMVLGDILRRILVTFQRDRVGKRLPLSLFCDFERVKPLLRSKLINLEKNEEMLREMPYDSFLDLAVVWYVDLSEESGIDATVLVRNAELDFWKTDKETVRGIAASNMKEKEPTEIRHLTAMVRSLRAELLKLPEGDMGLAGCLLPDEDGLPMYVMTTKGKNFGAVALMDAEAIGELARKLESDLYVLPSSIHEVILLPVDGMIGKETLSDMVGEVNRYEVPPQDVLSESLYRYDRASGNLSIEEI